MCGIGGGVALDLIPNHQVVLATGARTVLVLMTAMECWVHGLQESPLPGIFHPVCPATYGNPACFLPCPAAPVIAVAHFKVPLVISFGTCQSLVCLLPCSAASVSVPGWASICVRLNSLLGETPWLFLTLTLQTAFALSGSC